MSVGPFIFLLVAALVAALVAVSTVVDRLERVFTRLSLLIFGTYVSEVGRRRSERQRLLRAAHLATTYRTYASKTLLYSMVAAFVGGLMGMYVIWGVLRILAIDPDTMRAVLPPTLAFLADFAGLEALEPTELAPLFAASSLTIGAIAGLGTYWMRWYYPEQRATTRQRQIDASLPQTIAFMYALSRSGMEFPKVMELLAAHREIYGAAADEMNVAVRQMNLFGRDVVTAVQTMGHRTPSEKYREFTENLSSVLQSGQSVSSFLAGQYEEFQEEAEAQQQQLLNLLATLAEAYVTLFVAGPLFLITILVVLGIAGAETLTPMRLVVYLALPIGNLAFVAYLSSVTERFDGNVRVPQIEETLGGLDDVRRATGGRVLEALDSDDPTRSDGGIDATGSNHSGTEQTATDRSIVAQLANIERLQLYQRLQVVRSSVGSPVRTVLDRPATILYVTVPIAVVGTLFRLSRQDTLAVDVVDDLLVQAALFLLATFAVAYELHRRRIEAIEAAVPDFLDRLASVNEAGMSVIASVNSIRGSDLGALDEEVERLWADIQWGADVGTALRRFEGRVRTRTVSRVVVLITNAMNASGNISRVLRIAADQAKADRRLKRQRSQEMLTYVVVVYVAFGVFLVIIAALDTVLIPNLPAEGIVPDDGDAGQLPGTGGIIGDLGGIDASAYTLVFFHTALIQGVLSGLVAGQMSAGDVRAGAKHAAIMLGISYIVFLIL